jgi:hypothetical protein
MAAADGSFDSLSESLTGDVSALPAGSWTLGIRARDAAGNWGPVAHLDVASPGSDRIFADGFGGGLSAWSTIVGGTALATTPAAELHGADGWGLEVTVSGSRPAFVSDHTPTAEPSYRSRFYFDPGSSLTGRHAWTVFDARSRTGARLFKVAFRSRVTSGWGRREWLRIAARTPAGVVSGRLVPITAGVHRVEVAWDAAAGSLSLSVDGAASDGLAGLSISDYRLETADLGAIGGLSSTAAGVLRFDEFASARSFAIGP